jgi:hypothetical protein
MELQLSGAAREIIVLSIYPIFWYEQSGALRLSFAECPNRNLQRLYGWAILGLGLY